MGRPRKFASNAERQAAYRDRVRPESGLSLPDAVFEAVVARLPSSKEKCGAFAPRGTKCKFCGKAHA